MWTMGKSERLRCPKIFQDRITKAGGLNRYGGANFRLVWGQTETIRIATHGGYKNMLVAFNKPCWILQRWLPPEAYGTPEIYYAQNYDPETGRQFLGEYPWRGRYETLFMLEAKYVKNGKMISEPLPLNAWTLDMTIPMVKEALHLTEEQAALAVKEVHDREEKAKADELADMLQDASPTYKDAVSFSRQGCTSSVVQQRMAAIEKNWRKAATTFQRQRQSAITHHKLTMEA
jgi:hypothetical protein